MTIMTAPLLTCSARLPVYALLIGGFIPERQFGLVSVRWLVLFALFVAGVAPTSGLAHRQGKGLWPWLRHGLRRLRPPPSPCLRPWASLA